MIILFSSCFFAYITAIYYIVNKIEKDAFNMGFSVDKKVIIKKILFFQNLEAETMSLIPLIPIVNVLYAYKMMNIYFKYKHYIYQEFKIEKVFIKSPEKGFIENSETKYVSLENMIDNLLKELDEREYTIDDLIFFKKKLDVFKIKYTSRENTEKINQLEGKLIEIVIEMDKQKRLHK